MINKVVSEKWLSIGYIWAAQTCFCIPFLPSLDLEMVMVDDLFMSDFTIYRGNHLLLSVFMDDFRLPNGLWTGVFILGINPQYPLFLTLENDLFGSE